MVRSSVYNKLDLSDLFDRINLGGAAEADAERGSWQGRLDSGQRRSEDVSLLVNYMCNLIKMRDHVIRE